MTKSHDVLVTHYDDAWVADCSCGWSSGKTRAQASAEFLGNRHEDAEQ